MPRIPGLGTAGERRTATPPERADELAEMVLRDHRGAEHRLGDFWRDGPAVLVFLRHYGWIYCRAHAVQLHRDREQFEAAGAELVVIGQGQPEHAADFLRQHDVEGLRLLVDPDRAAYRAAGTKIATVGELLGPRVMAKGVGTALRTRKVQGRTKGHPAQLGGVLVIAPGGEVTWTHLSDDAGDNPPNETVLEAVRGSATA